MLSSLIDITQQYKIMILFLLEEVIVVCYSASTNMYLGKIFLSEQCQLGIHIISKTSQRNKN